MAKHEKTFVDFNKPYETNLIGLKGVIYFGVGLVLLIVITFGLMWFLQDVMEDQAVERDNEIRTPLMMNDAERLPPEPRLQAAPGFGVDSPQGRVNLELKAPQAEYRALHQQWEKLWAEGQVNPHTGTIVTLPIDQAKQKFLEQAAQKNGSAASQQGQNVFVESQKMLSSSSAGRTATITRR